MPNAPTKTANDQLADAMLINKQQRTKIVMLQKELAALHRDNFSVAEVRTKIYGISEFEADPPKWLIQGGKKGLPGVPMTEWSDWHYGEYVDPEAIGGVNGFNRAIAKERIRLLVSKTISLARDHMVNAVYPGIVVCLGGDFITGLIHDELRETNDGTLQQHLLEVEECLIWALLQIAVVFGKVFVPCVIGNHGRGTLKVRAKNRVYDSFEWNLYCRLERYFAHDKRFVFHVPGETDAYFRVYDHRFLLTHGDSLGVKGGDGIIGALGPIARGATKVGRAEAQVGRDFDTLIIGHYHIYIPRGDAVPVIVNGALKGYDEFARLFLRVPYSRPSQALWFLHEDHGITAQWPIYLDKRRKSSDGKAWVSFEKAA